MVGKVVVVSSIPVQFLFCLLRKFWFWTFACCIFVYAFVLCIYIWFWTFACCIFGYMLLSFVFFVNVVDDTNT
jgi:hypothetical protein